MKASQKQSSMPDAENTVKSVPRGWLLFVMALLLIIGTVTAFMQSPNPDPLSNGGSWNRFLYPIEINATQRLPAIYNTLNDLHVSRNNQNIWAVGEGGLIVHSSDSGKSWTQQNPVSGALNIPDQQASSILENLISTAHAAPPAPEFFDQMNQPDEENDLQQQQKRAEPIPPPPAPVPRPIKNVTTPQTKTAVPKLPDIKNNTELLTMPSLLGKSLTQANVILKKSGLLAGKFLYKEREEKPGIIFSQTPRAGSKIKRGSRVNLVISRLPSPKTTNTDPEKDTVDSSKQDLATKTVESSKPDPLLQTLNAVYFLDDAEHGWAVGNSGSILLTNNGGKHWKAANSSMRESLNSVFFTTKKEGWAVGKNTLLKTVDGGVNWKSDDDYFEKLQHYYSVFFSSENNGWAAGYAGAVFRYTKQGKRPSWSWQSRVSALSKGVTLNAIYFLDDRNGWIVGDGGTILSTTNGGGVWSLIKSGTDEQLNSVQFINANYGWVAGSNRTIRVTHDGGKTWKNKNTGTEKSLGPDINFDSKREASKDNKLSAIKTVNQPRENNKEPVIMDLQFADANHGWAVDNMGSILSTDNAGENWILKTRNNNWRLEDTNYQRYPAPWYYLLIGLALLLLNRLSHRQEEPGKQQESIADQLVSDRPLSRDDQDVLNLTAIADGLSRFIRNTRTEAPLTVAVTGAWGSGKSSLMNLLREDLEARSYQPIWFNAWHHQKGENLLASLVANIRSQGVPSLIARGSLGFRSRLLLMRGWRNWFKSGVMLLMLIASAAFIWLMENPLETVPVMVKSLLSFELESLGLGAIGGLLLPLAALIKALQAFGLNPKSMMHDMTAGMRHGKLAANPGARFQFAKEFDDVTQALDTRKMVILIDDLDRCQPDHVVEVLEIVNYLMTSGRCFVILGMDIDYVETCVGLKFEVLANATAQNGSEDNPEVEDRQSFARHYMEKLVNLRVTIPALDDRKSQQLLISDTTPKNPDSGWKLLTRTILARRFWMLGAIFLATIIWGGWQSGDWLHKNMKIPTPPVTGELKDMDATLHSITFLDEQRGFAVGEKGKILLTTDGGKTWRANSGELVKGLPEDTDINKTDVLETTPLPVKIENKTTEKPADFKHPQKYQAHWPEYVFPVAAALALLTGLMFLLQRPAVSERDSPLFTRALEIWQPWIVLRRQTPRLLKRFLNEVRYLAMQYRTLPVRLSIPDRMAALVRRIFGKSEKATPALDTSGLNEAKIVALSAIHQLNPAWISNQSIFQHLLSGKSVKPLLEKDFTELFKNDTGEINQDQLNNVAKKMDAAIKNHLQDISINTQFPDEDDRNQFLAALHGIQVKPKTENTRHVDLAISA